MTSTTTLKNELAKARQQYAELLEVHSKC